MRGDLTGHRPMEDLEFFQTFEEVAAWCWKETRKWDRFAQDTLGKQLVKAVDSIGANLVEGDGRHGTSDPLRFFIMARASAREARLWLKRNSERGLLCPIGVEEQIAKLTHSVKILNLVINYRRDKAKNQVKEAIESYGRALEEDPFTHV